MKKVVIVLAAAFFTCAVIGCSSGKLSIEDGKAKIEELAARGVPEREMSSIRMYLFRMETAQKTGNSSQFRTYQDSLTTALASLEARMSTLLEEAGPFMDSLRAACNEKLPLLRGLHLTAAQRNMGRVDSLMQIESQKLYARSRLEAWSAELDTLIMQQALADSLRSRFVGKWVTESESPNPAERIVERTEINMFADGSLIIYESRVANTPDLKEDWLFESRGTWDLLGDVAHHSVTREKRVRQILEGIDPATGQRRRESQPPYDSIVVPGSRDRIAAWRALNDDYKFFPLRR